MFWYWCKWQLGACDYRRRDLLYGEFLMRFVYGIEKPTKEQRQAMSLVRNIRALAIRASKKNMRSQCNALMEMAVEILEDAVK